MLRLFRDEQGSTALAVCLSVVLAVTLMALSLQIYWVKSSSSDIQAVADYGALAAADAIAKVSTTIQVLDAVLLSMNVFGLMLHATVLVGGVAAVAAAPVGGASIAPIVTKLADFDRKFMQVRKDLAQSAYNAAFSLNRAAPFLAMAQCWEVVRSNTGSLKAFGGVTYSGVVVPFPFDGSVTLTGYPDELDELADEVVDAGRENQADSQDVVDLQAELELARRACYAADPYRASGTSLVGWEPRYAIDDFRTEVERLLSSHPSAPSEPQSIEGSPSADGRLAECFSRDYRRVGESVQDSFTNRSGYTDSQGYLDPGVPTVGDYLDSFTSEFVLVVPHDEGNRKAYHGDRSCFGLYSVGEEPEPVRLGTLIGDNNHPPCSLCKPLHWSAVQVWQEQLSTFSSHWAAEAAAIRHHEDIRRELDRTSEQISQRTTDVLGELLRNASGYLLGGRLSYSPCGSRGLLCVVTAEPGRKLPNYTLPRLTGTAGKTMDRQIALSGSKIMPTTGQHATLDYLKTLSSTPVGLISGMGGALNESAGRFDGVLTYTNPLWRACVGTFSGGQGLPGWFSSLPWGLDAVLRDFVSRVAELAQVGPPDLRQLSPVLVNTASVGDPADSGAEGRVARALRAAQDSVVRGSSVTSLSIGSEIQSVLGGRMQYGYAYAYQVFVLSLMGKALKCPFSSMQLKTVQDATAWAIADMPKAFSVLTR